ncbi:MAG: lysozyme inhibitor LprI family protein [Pseudomonadota bacterium]
MTEHTDAPGPEGGRNRARPWGTGRARPGGSRRAMLPILALFLISSETLSAQADACLEKAEQELPASLAMVRCALVEATESRVEMDRIFEDAKAELSVDRSKDFLRAFEQSQKDWESYIGTACEADALIYERGTLKEWRRARCVDRLAADRTAYLVDLIEEPKN